MMLLKTGLLLTTLFASLLATNNADAAIFKCVGDDGEVSYNQTPCPVAEKTAKVISTAAANTTNYDCRIANNFARQTAMNMRSGQSSGDVFASYGGIDAVPRTAIGVINYVYTHKGNVDTGPQRIAALSAARCSAGSYGQVGCDDFPYNFISELGGCEAASGSTLSKAKPAVDDVPADNFATSGATQALGVRTAQQSGAGPEARLSSIECKNNVQNQLNELFTQMRSGQSGSSQNQLEDQKDKLKTQLSGC